MSAGGHDGEQAGRTKGVLVRVGAPLLIGVVLLIGYGVLITVDPRRGTRRGDASSAARPAPTETVGMT